MYVDLVNIDAVLNDVYDIIDSSELDEGRLINWASAAHLKMAPTHILEPQIAFLEVENHSATLPDDLKLIDQMAYKLSNEITSTDLTDIQRVIGIDNESYYNGFLTSSYYTSNYRPLRLSTSSFALSVHCSDCVNITCQSEHTYTVRPNRKITTSFKNGYICLAYFRVPVDTDGNFLIPNDQGYITALSKYCLYKFWERLWNLKEEGSRERYVTYKRDWGVARKAAIGEIRMLGLDQLENIRQLRNRLVPRERRYYSFFSNMSEEEKIPF